MTDRQRAVLVVALGAVAVVGAVTVNRLLAADDWFAYAPNTSVTFSGSDEAIWREAAVWLCAIVAWALPSLWLLRARRGNGD